MRYVPTGSVFADISSACDVLDMHMENSVLDIVHAFKNIKARYLCADCCIFLFSTNNMFY